MKRCAFLAMENTDGWTIDADLGIAPLNALGWSVDSVPWRRADVDWNAWDAVYIGTPWDYPDDAELFLDNLQRIDRSAAVLVNPLALVRWSLAKTYLRDLETRGAAIVPSQWHDKLTDDMVDDILTGFDSKRVIVKPVISTNARDTFLLDADPDNATRRLLLRTFATRPFVVQPFISAIQTEGEFSLFYLGGAYSHTVQKVPKARDFRVQEEHGARIEAVAVDDRLVAAADAVLERVEPAPVYARCDLVRGDDGRFLLMELEVIEPSLYLRMHDEAPARFAAAFDCYVKSQ